MGSKSVRRIDFPDDLANAGLLSQNLADDVRFAFEVNLRVRPETPHRAPHVHHAVDDANIEAAGVYAAPVKLAMDHPGLFGITNTQGRCLLFLLTAMHGRASQMPRINATGSRNQTPFE